MLTSRVFASSRHTTHYREAGPPGGPLLMFLHGWPGNGLQWRAQMDAFAAEGWHCVAPDMRGYGGSSAPTEIGAYALEEIVADMVELHDHLGGAPAIWAGHDWGSPVAASLAAHHPSRSRGGVVLVSLPYFPGGFALPSLVPLVDRGLYPEERYPDGQWDYYRFYETHFETSVRDLEADVPATLASLYRPGNPTAAGQLSPSASVTRNGGRYGDAHRAPPTPPDPSLWPPGDFDALVEAFRTTGFRPASAWYRHDAANIAYARRALDGGRLRAPVLYVNGDRDLICDIHRSRLGDPMRASCEDLTVASLPSGHWLPLEHKTELVESMRAWLMKKGRA